jgi:methyl-accepting chemotaxis protein
VAAEQSASSGEVSASTETLRAQVEHVQLQAQALAGTARQLEVLVGRFTTDMAAASEHRTDRPLRRVA